MRCPSCGLDNDPSSQFCARCHTTLQAGTAPETLRPADPFPASPSRRPSYAWPLAVVGVAAVIGTTILTVLTLSNGDGEVPAAARSATAEPSVVVPSSPSSPGPVVTTVDTTAQAASQAAALDRLLTASGASRQKLIAANGQVSGCRGLSQALAQLRAVGEERQAQLDELKGLDLSAIPEGERLRDLLGQALTHSLTADGHYVRWAEKVSSGSCSGGDGHRVDGDDVSRSAGASKTAFLAAWNPVAQRYGLPTRTRDDI